LVGWILSSFIDCTHFDLFLWWCLIISEFLINTQHSCSILTDLLDVGVNLNKIKDCLGDPNANAENPVLKAEQDAQVGLLEGNL
jgi:hypothetical protein